MQKQLRFPFPLFVLLLAACPLLSAQQPIRHTVRFPAPATHYVEVESAFPTDGKPAIDLYMAVWTPGSYLVREYSRNIEAFSATTTSGKALAWQKTRKNRWHVETGGAPEVRVRYRVYAHVMSVQGNWVDASFAMLNGAANYMTLEETARRPHEVTVEPATGWNKVLTGLPAAPDGRPNHFLAPDFDTLLDCPVVAGNPAVYEFEVAGKKHYLVNQGEQGVWDGPKSASDVRKIVDEYNRMWGGLPYDRYYFLNILEGAGGGLEHKNSTVMMASRWNWRADSVAPEGRKTASSGRLRWLGLVAHEYFHAWNVKRLRPVALGPFDYENEVYTPNLWVAEGFTSYYGPLALRRTGLDSQEQFLGSLSGIIRDLQTTPGRLVQTADEASYDAWIKLYRRDENSINTQISYYTKGAVIGFLLDAKIRRATNGRKSLDDAMKLAYQRYSGERGYTPEEFRKTCSEVAGTDLASWFDKAVDTTSELDYGDALDWYGLEFRPSAQPRQAWMGVATKNDDGRLVVSAVLRGTPGYNAGVNVDDEILAVNDLRVGADQLQQRIRAYQPGDEVTLLVARREVLLKIPVKLAAELNETWQLQVNPKASDAQKEHLRAWLME